MSSCPPLDFIRASARDAADQTRAFATLTVIDPELRKERFCLEPLSPSQYERLADELQHWMRAAAAAGQSTPPLNERAHVDIVALDIDDGSLTEEAANFSAAAVRSVFSMHFGVETAANAATRITASGARKHHLFFPHALNVDPRVLDVVLALARVTAAVDRAPSQQRHLRVHGTDRRDESGRFTGAGIYGLSGGINKRGVPLLPNEEPPGCWYSVRAGEATIRSLLLDPACARPYARTRVALNMMAERPTPRRAPVAFAYVVAAAGGDEARGVELLQADNEASWFVVSSRLCCGACCDERTEHRILARLAPFSDADDAAWMAIYRWALCLGCQRESGDVQSLAPLCVPLAAAGSDTIDVREPPPPPLELSFASQDSILNLPTEVVYPAGLGDVDESGVANLAQRRVPPHVARAATTVAVLARQLLQLAPPSAREPLSISESRLHLTAADCTALDAATGEPRTYLWTGLSAHPEPPLPVGAHSIELWATPCAGGKTVAAIKYMLAHLAPDERLLVVAPRKALCCQLQERIVSVTEQTDAGHWWLDRVCLYKGLSAAAAASASVIVTTLESLPRFAKQQFGGVIVDEFCTVAHTLHGKTTKAQCLTVLGALVRVLARASRVVLMDRDIDAGERLVVAHVAVEMQSMRWPRTNVADAVARAPALHVRHVTMEDSVRRTVELWHNADQMRAHMQLQLLAGKNIAVFCATKSDAESMAESFGHYFGAEYVTLITGDTDDDAKLAFGRAPDRHFAAAKTRVWIFTTAVSVGISVDDERFDEVFVFGDKHLSLRDLLQAEARVRQIVGQLRGERRIHICLPATIVDQTHSLRTSMPTLGGMIAEHEYALRHTHVVAADGVAVPAAPMTLLPTVALDCEQLYQPTAVVLLALAAFGKLERRLTRTVFEHWRHDAGVKVVEHAPLADPRGDVQLVAARTVHQAGAANAAAKRKAQQALGGDAEQQKRARGGDSFAAPHLAQAAERNIEFADWSNKHAKVHVRVWLASLVCDTPLLSKALLTGQRHAGGASNAVEPFAGVALLGKLALQFLGLSHVLRGQSAPPPTHWRIDVARCGTALSPYDACTQLTPDAFFERVAQDPLFGKPPKALLPAVGGCSEHFRSLVRGKRYTDDGEPHERTRRRIKLLAAIVRHCYGDVEKTHRYIWSLVHWLEQQSVVAQLKERLFDEQTRTLLASVASGNPWAIESGAPPQLLPVDAI